MKVSDYIIDFFQKQGTEVAFSLSGGMITHLEDSIFLNKKMQLVSVRHEQAGAFAAEGYARSTGKTGLAMGTSGPGATNMMTGIASAYFDGVPVIYIAGQVNTHEITKKEGIRQTGFQEADIVSMTGKITKFSYQIQSHEEIRYILEKSFFIAHEGRKGPVLLDIPMNIQKQEIHPETLPSFYDSKEYKKQEKVELSQKDIETVLSLLQSSKKPVILLGGGMKYIQNKALLEEISIKFNIPVVSSLLGLDCYNQEQENFIGMIGSYGNRAANIALMNADTLLILGSRLDIRQTGALKEKFVGTKILIQVDINASELGYTLPQIQHKIQSKLDIFIAAMYKHISVKSISFSKEEWLKKCVQIKNLIQKNIPKTQNNFHNPSVIVSELSKLIKKNTIIVNDVGQNQMISSTSFSLKKNWQILNSGGLGSMGFSLPTSIGCAFGNKKSMIISLNGDGGFQMNIQELETIIHHKLPILIIILNNKSLGMVREFQDAYFEGRNIGTVLGYSCPNFGKIAKAYGLDYYKIATSGYKKTLEKVSDIKSPTLLEIFIDEKAGIPKVMFGNTIDEQSPELDIKLKEKIQKLLK